MSNARFGLRVRNGLVRGITEISNDSDVVAFIGEAGITSPIQQSAIRQLVFDLKTFGLWTKLRAIYPFVGGTALAHRFNLKDARDLDAAFRLTFSGGITHSNDGCDFNGINGFANTFFNTSTSMAGFNNNHSLTLYIRTQQPSVGAGWHTGVGNTSSGEPLYGLAIRRFSGSPTNARVYDSGNVSGNGRLIDTTLDARGFYIGNAIAANNRKLFRNGTAVLTQTNNVTGISPNASIYLGSINPSVGSQFFLQGQFAFASIGDGLTDTEAANFYTAVQTFQTTLGRQV